LHHRANAIEVGLFPPQYHEETRSIIATLTVQRLPGRFYRASGDKENGLTVSG
jgi:hypothetical protein